MSEILLYTLVQVFNFLLLAVFFYLYRHDKPMGKLFLRGGKMSDDKFDNQPILFAVTESELQRFRKIETENTLLKAQIEKLKEGKQYETCPYRSTDMGCDYCDYRDRNLKDEWEMKE